MTTFPTLTPAARTWTPGEYPNAAINGINGKSRTVRQSNAVLHAQLQLQFQVITSSQLQAIATHYLDQRGCYVIFDLPSQVWNGVTTADYQLSGYLWRYLEAPKIKDLPCGIGHDVELKLEAVPNEGASVAGAGLMVTASISGGGATAANGLAQTVTLSISGGAVNVASPGLAQTVTWSQNYAYPTENGALFGLRGTITLSISGGTATGDNLPSSDYWADWISQVYGWDQDVSIDWWGF